MAAKRQSKQSSKTVMWSTHGQSLVDRVAVLRTTHADFSDITVKVEGMFFPCHRLILVMQSKYFEDLLRPAPGKSSANAFTVSHVEAAVFERVLNFMYTGAIELNNDDLESMLSAADAFEMEPLKSVCLEYMRGALSKDNCFDIWRAANSIGETALAQTAMQMFCSGAGSSFITPQKCQNLPEKAIQAIMRSDDIRVTSEVQMCEVMLSWLENETNAGRTVRPETLLPLIRWSAIDVEYTKSKLLTNQTLTSNKACFDFLSKVLTYHLTGAPFQDLLTFLRPSTGVEKCMVIVGISDQTTFPTGVYRISLQRQHSITGLPSMPVDIPPEVVACTYTDSMFYITGAGSNYDEVWRWDQVGAWIRCCNMSCGRRRHSAAFIGKALYMLGGLNDDDTKVMDSVEKLDTMTNRCSIVGLLSRAIQNSNGNCVVYDTRIYMFGGAHDGYKKSDCIQMFDTTSNSCTLLTQRLPQPHTLMRSVLWDSSVILLGLNAC